MSDKTPIFHIGLPKAASTWLQKEIFPYLPGIQYIGPDVANDLVQVSDSEFAAANFVQRFNLPADATESPALISTEALSGAFDKGAVDMKRNALRIKEIAPDARIILVLRNQTDFVESLYRQMVKQGATYSPQQWWNAPFHYPNTLVPSTLHWHYLIELYSSLFGMKNIHVIFMEKLRTHPSECLQDLCRFVLGTDAGASFDNMSEQRNVSLHSSALKLMRFYNRIGHGPYNTDPLIPWVPRFQKIRKKASRKLNPLLKKSGIKSVRLTGALDEDIFKTCHESNAKAAKLLGIDLKGLGYP